MSLKTTLLTLMLPVFTQYLINNWVRFQLKESHCKIKQDSFNPLVMASDQFQIEVRGIFVCVCVCVCRVLLMLWGHKSVYTVSLWGLASLMGTQFKAPLRKPLHFSVMTRFKVRVRLGLG